MARHDAQRPLLAAVAPRNAPLGKAARAGRARPRPPRRWSASWPSPRARPITASSRRGASSPSPTTSAMPSSVVARGAFTRESGRDRAQSEGATSSPITRDSWSCSISAPLQDHKIPLWEQELSCGAAGNEPAAGRPRARLCRRLGDRLARIFRARADRLLRTGRADRRLHLHRPRRRASSRIASARRLRRVQSVATAGFVTIR